MLRVGMKDKVGEKVNLEGPVRDVLARRRKG